MAGMTHPASAVLGRLSRRRFASTDPVLIDTAAAMLLSYTVDKVTHT